MNNCYVTLKAARMLNESRVQKGGVEDRMVGEDMEEVTPPAGN